MTALPQLPSQRDVLMEHFRAIGYALRIPMIIAVVLAVLGTIAIAIQVASGDIDKNLLAEPSRLPGVVGALLAIAVWAREERFGPGFLWILPVERMRHAMLKVLAGWLWLMIGLVLFSLCQLVLALVSGAGVLPIETLQLLTVVVPRGVPIDPAVLRTVQYAPGPLIWAVPFGGATATYLLVSAFMLAARRPLLWVVGAVLLFLVSSGVTHVMSRLPGLQWLADSPERALDQIIDGRFGLEALLTLHTWSLDRRAKLLSGEGIHVWTGVPNLSDWRIAALLWTAAGLLALWAAAYQHREERRA
jgi:hypothetical protein